MISYYDIIYDVDYDMTYDIIDRCSNPPAAALGSPSCGSGLPATLPRLCHSELSLRCLLLILSA
jgi:hypothetical protein